MFSWTRNFYAKHNNNYYCFEQKKDRDDAIIKYGFQKISANEAYKNYPCTKISINTYKNQHQFKTIYL